MTDSSNDVARLLQSLSQGDDSAAEALFPLVYEELHRLAAHYMRTERDDHTLQPTALINEAYLRLAKVSEDTPSYENKDHFVATAAVVMRRILVNHAKAKKTQKRGAGKPLLQLAEVTEAFDQRSVDLVALDAALVELEQIDPVQHRLVELRFFGGMTTKQCASMLKISERTVFYEWAHARAWLRSQIEAE
jgi:RNA polymerase sigma factor (TIGR02999 family)